MHINQESGWIHHVVNFKALELNGRLSSCFSRLKLMCLKGIEKVWLSLLLWLAVTGNPREINAVLDPSDLDGVEEKLTQVTKAIYCYILLLLAVVTCKNMKHIQIIIWKLGLFYIIQIFFRFFFFWSNQKHMCFLKKTQELDQNV